MFKSGISESAGERPLLAVFVIELQCAVAIGIIVLVDIEAIKTMLQDGNDWSKLWAAFYAGLITTLFMKPVIFNVKRLWA